MELLLGKKGIIIGVANERSICWGIAKECLENGAEIIIGYTEQTKERVENLIKDFKNAKSFKCDCGDDNSIHNFFEFVRDDFGNIDFIVCAPAFANKECLKGDYFNVCREDFLQAMNISVYSLTAISRIFSPIMNDGGSILTLSYYGAEKIVQNYNVMGVAKAALETSVKYLANDFGKHNIRVNSISAGPVRTLASSAIGGFKQVLAFTEKQSPLKRNITQEDVAKCALFLLSDMSKNITAENIHVDCGLNAVGMILNENE